MKKILLVDDSEVNLYLISSIFESHSDIDITMETSGKKALQIINKEAFDLLVLDLMMPHVDGIYILDHIKADEKLKSIPVIVISAKEDIETIDYVMGKGVIAYIKKPIVLNSLEAKILEVLKLEMS